MKHRKQHTKNVKPSVEAANPAVIPKPEKTMHTKTIKKQIKKTFREQIKFFNTLLNKAGIELDFEDINTKISKISISITLILTIYLIIQFDLNNTFPSDAFGFLLTVWTFGVTGIFMGIWLGFLILLDMIINKRKKEVEAYFPDFLQLTAANINAGMPVDQSLWYAIRPRFGTLAVDMETVAKSTMVGEKLTVALSEFSTKYDSVTIQRAIALLIEGMESGSEIGDLLSRIATNMRETEIIKKEMASSVTTYVIFILFATLGAAPFLFGLTTVLVVIMKSILAQINIGSSGQSFGGIGGMLSTSTETIGIADYQTFAVVSIIISSIFSAIIISVIQKGDAKESVKNIPLYITIGIVNYFISYNLLTLMLGGLFS
ncbi:MAG: type II secretion system F family protein [archaeon]